MKETKFSLQVLFFLLAISVANISCRETESNKEKENPQTKHRTSPVTKPPSGLIDTLFINRVTAVFFEPGSSQLQRIKESVKEMDFKSAEHDCFYQQRNARLLLKNNWPHIQVLNTSTVRFLCFIKKNKDRIVLDLDTKNDMCGVFFFDTLQEPVLADMTNFETEIARYYHQ